MNLYHAASQSIAFFFLLLFSLGIGVGYSVLNSLVCIYYNVIIALSLYYLFGSFTSNLPWATCGNPWNTANCGDPTLPINCTIDGILLLCGVYLCTIKAQYAYINNKEPMWPHAPLICFHSYNKLEEDVKEMENLRRLPVSVNLGNFFL